MNNVISKGVILGFYDKCGEYEKIHLEEGKDYEITIKATFADADNLDLSFVSDLSDMVINVDDIINIEEAN
nr:MAG TPA: hypothetical protein [Bacteriophage sp.]